MSDKEKGAFLPVTQIWDANEVYQTEGISEGMKELLVRMYQRFSEMTMMINKKDTGIYPTEEFVCGKQYFSKPGLYSSSLRTPRLRQIVRKVINFGALPKKNVPKSVAHGISFNADSIVTSIYGAATDPVALNYIPVPYTSGLTPVGALGVKIDSTNVTVNCSADFDSYTICYIVIEFLKF